jgi:hypothetical protein
VAWRPTVRTQLDLLECHLGLETRVGTCGGKIGLPLEKIKTCKLDDKQNLTLPDRFHKVENLEQDP